MEERTKPSGAAVAWAVTITIVFGVIVWSVLFALAKAGIYGSMPMVGWQGRIVVLSIVPAIAYLPFHVLISRIVAILGLFLADQVDRVFQLEHGKFGNWTGSTSVVFGAFWPLSQFHILFLVVALLFGALYRFLWPH